MKTDMCIIALISVNSERNTQQRILRHATRCLNTKTWKEQPMSQQKKKTPYNLAAVIVCTMFCMLFFFPTYMQSKAHNTIIKHL